MSTSQRWSPGAGRPTGWPRINYNLHYQDNAKNQCARMTRWRWLNWMNAKELVGDYWWLPPPIFFLPCNHLVQLFSLFVVSSSAFKDCPTFWPGTIHEIREGVGVGGVGGCPSFCSWVASSGWFLGNGGSWRQKIYNIVSLWVGATANRGGWSSLVWSP